MKSKVSKVLKNKNKTKKNNKYSKKVNKNVMKGGGENNESGSGSKSRSRRGSGSKSRSRRGSGSRSRSRSGSVYENAENNNARAERLKIEAKQAAKVNPSMYLYSGRANIPSSASADTKLEEPPSAYSSLHGKKRSDAMKGWCKDTKYKTNYWTTECDRLKKEHWWVY